MRRQPASSASSLSAASRPLLNVSPSRARRVRRMSGVRRYGEARGDYDHVVATLNRLDPH